MREQKTYEDVVKLATMAFHHGIEFKFLPADDPSKRILVNHGSSAWIYADMNPTEMWYEIKDALEHEKVNINLYNFTQLQSMIESLENSIT